MLPFDHDRPSGKVVAYIDGGARGNPGPAGFGVRIEEPDGTLIEEFAESIGVATNNVAEYRALLAALEWAKRHGRDQLHVRSDSLLLVQQMLGNYKVKNAGLQPLHAKARVLTKATRRNARMDQPGLTLIENPPCVAKKPCATVVPQIMGYPRPRQR
jgi:ribonuclease HI